MNDPARLSLLLEREHLDILCRMAAEEDRSVSSLVRRIIGDHLNSFDRNEGKMERVLTYYSNNAYDIIVLTLDDRIISEWTVSDKEYSDYRAAMHNPTEITNWDEHEPSSTKNIHDSTFGQPLVRVTKDKTAILDADLWINRCSFFEGDKA